MLIFWRSPPKDYAYDVSKTIELQLTIQGERMWTAISSALMATAYLVLIIAVL